MRTNSQTTTQKTISIKQRKLKRLPDSNNEKFCLKIVLTVKYKATILKYAQCVIHYL